MNLALDQVVEQQRLSIQEWKRQLQTMAPEDVLVRFVRSRDFDRAAFEALWEGQKLPEGVERGRLDEAVRQQCRRLGPDVAARLFAKLVGAVVDQSWLIYQRDLEAIRQCLPLYRLEPRHLVVEYTRTCHEQMRQFRRDVMNHLLSYFLSAMVESRVPVAAGEADMKGDFHATADVEQSRMLNLHPEEIPA